ncbi:MAG: DNA-3-methyladenine glycosylase [Bacteroidetes bacterium]|nr:DNA-3-methyladenine glycosylase [Bacteroidota bacterium]
MTPIKLKSAFYNISDTIELARNLLGKVLCTHLNGVYSSAIITETEAYLGETDRASHAWNGKRTTRTETMFQTGGIAYVYLCYGLHNMMNVVTGQADYPHAVLIRAGEPLDGIDQMLIRRKKVKTDKNLLGGPGSFCQAMGIDRSLNAADLTGELIWIEDRGIVIPNSEILSGPRIGVDYAGEDAKLPYRFWVTGKTVVL